MSRLSSQIAYNTIGNLVTLVFQWIIVMAIPKITDFSDAGVFAVALSITSLANIIATMNLAQYQVADQYEKFSENDYFVKNFIVKGPAGELDRRRVVCAAVEAGLPVPALSSALAYYDLYRCSRSGANLLQAQRDYFGAHTYERTDRPRGEFFHTEW